MIQSAIRDFYRAHQVPNPINLTLTQKQFAEGQKLDELASVQNFKHFSNLLNRRIFGNAFKRFGRKLSMFVISETGAWQRHHLHVVIECPQHLTVEEFIALVLACWLSTRFGYHEHHFEVPADRQRRDGWITYCLKKRTKTDLASSIDWVNSTCFERRRA